MQRSGHNHINHIREVRNVSFSESSACTLNE